MKGRQLTSAWFGPHPWRESKYNTHFLDKHGYNRETSQPHCPPKQGIREGSPVDWQASTHSPKVARDVESSRENEEEDKTDLGDQNTLSRVLTEDVWVTTSPSMGGEVLVEAVGEGEEDSESVTRL